MAPRPPRRDRPRRRRSGRHRSVRRDTRPTDHPAGPGGLERHATQRDAFRPIVEFIHYPGAAAGIQLAHAGRKASVFRPWSARHGTVPLGEGRWPTVGPSTVAFPGFAAPRELDAVDIAQIVAAFGAAARRALEAGLDFVELHAAHGYLLHQFLSPLSNTRTGGYGGSLRHRARLLLETVDAVRAKLPESAPLLARFSGTDWVPGGWTVEDTGQVAQWAVEHGVDMVDVSSGGSGPDADIPRRTGLPGAAGHRGAFGGRRADHRRRMIDEPHQAEQVVATGLADVVMVGRQLLRDPHFPLRAAAALRVELPCAPPPYHRAPIT